MHTCVHSYSEECHDTFVTTYEPHQEEECDEKFRKTCTIWNEDVALNEEVEVCNTRYLVSNILSYFNTLKLRLRLSLHGLQAEKP